MQVLRRIEGSLKDDEPAPLDFTLWGCCEFMAQVWTLNWNTVEDCRLRVRSVRDQPETLEL